MTTPWLTSRKPNRRAALRLFCLPYAGGGASIFHSWQQSLSDTIEVCAVLLPGRDSRIAEPPYTEMDQLVRVMAEGLSAYLDKPFALFGHSMGALIAFELARQLRRDYGAQPVHFFAAGRCSPQTVSAALDLEHLTPEEGLENPELIELVLPVVRADLVLCKSYNYTLEPPFRFPITAFGGLDDHGAPRGCLEGWRKHTTERFVLRMFPGDHFFINTCRLPLLEALSRELCFSREAAKAQRKV
jgi:medium-chain acyl-[acyl-carrier-protein] hydrolase